VTAKCPLRAQAKAEGRTKYFSPRPCKRGHVGERWTHSGCCAICVAAQRMKRYYEKGGKERGRLDAQKRRDADPIAERQRAVRVTLKSKYGISETQYLEMFEAQQGCCAVCRRGMVSRLDTSRPLYSGRGAPSREVARVDHCHVSKQVRGLLCSDCNIMLGHAHDDEEILLTAVRYLRASRATAHAISRAQTRSLQGEAGPHPRDPESSPRRGSRRDELSPFFPKE
jgi:sarcosine oxidase delta subunit